MRFKGDEKVSKASTYFSIINLIALSGALSILIVKLYRLTRNLNEETISLFKTQYSKLNESLRESKHTTLIVFWKILNLLR